MNQPETILQLQSIFTLLWFNYHSSRPVQRFNLEVLHNLNKFILFNVFVLLRCHLVCLRLKIPSLIICVIENLLSLNGKFFFVYTVSMVIGYDTLMLLHQYLKCNKMKRSKNQKNILTWNKSRNVLSIDLLFIFIAIDFDFGIG